MHRIRETIDIIWAKRHLKSRDACVYRIHTYYQGTSIELYQSEVFEDYNQGISFSIAAIENENFKLGNIEEATTQKV